MKSLRVLVIEDEAIIGMLLREVLEGMGHTVVGVAATEGAAVALAAEYQPDLLIVDAGLTSGDGLSAVDTITGVRFVPHIFTTGNAMNVRLAKPDAVILEKPFDEEALIAAMERALALASDGD